MSNLPVSGRLTPALAVAAVLGFCLGANAQTTDPNNGYGPHDRPCYAFISVPDTFALPEITKVDGRLRNKASTLGSKVILLKIGTFFAGDTVETTRFLSDGTAFFDPLAVPVEPGTVLTPADFEDNHVTMVGSFRTIGPDALVHLMTPYALPISRAVQEAYFNASVFFENGQLSPFPSTVEVALFIFDNQGTAGAAFNDILQEIFFVDLGFPVVLGPPPPAPAPPILTGEGDFFPHTPGEGLFGFDIDFNFAEGSLDADIALKIDIDVKPGNAQNILNVKDDKGVVTVAVLSGDGFDAILELDPDTVVAVVIDADGEVITEVPGVRFQTGDGAITFKFSMKNLGTGPNAVITATSTTLTLRGQTYDGMTVQGSDFLKIVPK